MNKDFLAFKDYICLKNHFNVWEYNWNPDKTIRISADAFEKRKDKAYFHKVSYNLKDRNTWIEHYTTSFLSNPRCWIGAMFDEDIIEAHMKRMKRRRALLYNFRVDMECINGHLEESGGRFIDLLKIGRTQPGIFETRIEGGVTEESLAILDAIFDYTKYGSMNPLWNETRLKLNKYRRILAYDMDLSPYKSSVDHLLRINS